MKKLVLTMIVMCGLLGAMRAGDTPAQAIAPAPAATQPAASSVDDDAACDGAAVSEDAQSCSAGGWVPQLTCCFVSGRALERWRLNGVTKCCGACFQ